jgi:carboxyl-terminal processing protease
MSRKRAAFLVLSLAVMIPIVTGVLWSAATERRADDGEDSLYKYLSIFSEVFGLVRSSYVDETDARALLAGALEGAGDALDPFSTYVPAEGVEAYERALAAGPSRSGLALADDQGIVYVLGVEAGSPAATAGFQTGDIVAEVDGRSTRELAAWQLASLLAGEPGASLACDVLREGEEVELTLVLADYAAPAPSIERVREQPVLHPGRFVEGTAGAVRPLLAELAAAGGDRLLVDLRGAAGGSAPAAYEIAGLFASGSLGKLAGRDGVVRDFGAAGEPVWKGRLVVLVDGYTQGPAEVLAAALKQRAGAKLVGLPSFGWAGEREMVALEGGARLHLTTAFYTGPDGEPIAEGLEPDLLVDDLAATFGEREKPVSERILEHGLELLVEDGDGERRAA